MTWRGDEAQAEALQVVERIVQCMDFQFTAVAGAGIDLADGQTAAETALRRAVKLRTKLGEFRIVRNGFRDRRSQALEECPQHWRHTLLYRRTETATPSVIPAKAGIEQLDSRFRGNDG